MQRYSVFRRVSLTQRTHECSNLQKLSQNRRLCTPAPGTPNPKAEKAVALANRGPITYLSLAIAGIALGSVLVYYKTEKEKKTQRVASVVKTTGKAAIGGPWVLVDKEGIPRTDAHYKGKGKFQILYFGFTFCPDICPSELVKIGKVLDILDKKGMDVTPLFISVDPTRDTVQQLQNYSQDFHPKIQYLTGTKEQVAKASKAYRVYFSKANENENDDTDYLVDHSIVFYLLDPAGEFVDFFTQRMQVGDMIEKVLQAKVKWDLQIKETAEAAAAAAAAAAAESK